MRCGDLETSHFTLDAFRAIHHGQRYYFNKFL